KRIRRAVCVTDIICMVVNIQFCSSVLCFFRRQSYNFFCCQQNLLRKFGLLSNCFSEIYGGENNVAKNNNKKEGRFLDPPSLSHQDSNLS
ncbi:MAG: hypothetical protein IJ250_01070, partial [Bacteroidales bacterium]|nr:hypothetical protein [Bacteroidales bacterium]